MKEINFNSKGWGILFIFLAFLFGVWARFYWIGWASEFDAMMHNGVLMINTNDGYAFAEGARDIIAGFHQPNDLSFVDSSMSKFTAFVCKILPFSFENVILYMSVFLSSLLVIPVILIAREYKATEAGIIGAFVSVVAMSYYNRTMAGYYDTDMLNIVLATFVVWGLIRVALNNYTKSSIIAPVFMLIYLWWYPSSFTLNSALLGIFTLYTCLDICRQSFKSSKAGKISLKACLKKEIFNEKHIASYETIVLLLVVLTNLSLSIKLIAIFGLYALFFRGISLKTLGIITIIVGVLFIYFGGLNPIFFQLRFYILRDVSEIKTATYHFFNVNQTIQESGIVDYDMFMRRISSDKNLFILSLIGYTLFCIKHRSFLITLPMLGLGFLATKAGLRFTIYAVPIMGLGLGFLVHFILDVLKANSLIRIAVALVVTVFAVQPALKHIEQYKSPTVFFNKEVEVLEELKGIASREDYVVAWWDYGYPIRYYADVKTLIDGGKHLGHHNYPVSFSLTKDMVSSANMARVEVEYTERQFSERFVGKIDKILQDYNLTDVNDLITSMGMTSFTVPEKTRDIYYYLPKRMLNIYNVIALFSDIDLKTGKSFGSGVFTTTYSSRSVPEGLLLENGAILSHDMKFLKFGSQDVPVKSFYDTEHGETFSMNEIKINPDGMLSIIFSKNDGTFVIVDDKVLNSAYIQLFLLERYDSRYFEQVISTPYAKVYKLKI
ncbi:MAG: general glycosylation pathway protein [Campylobacteraceae bacterium]|nr:general glycosylation pathway protein [Campylobacteraceae bacterium]